VQPGGGDADRQRQPSYSGTLTAINETDAGATISTRCFGSDGLAELTDAWSTGIPGCGTQVPGT
jgi:hypothetical protein